MNTKPKLRIATRASKLARIQATTIGEALKQHSPAQRIEYVPVTTVGDRSAQIGNLPPKNKDDFVREIETLLLDNTVDLAIHSMKDVPTKIPDGLTVHAVLPREDPRDVLVGADNVFCLAPDARIGTSSPRRHALLRYRTKFNNVVSVRGNVDTRLHKLDNDEYDAVILAAAGLHRLQLQNRIDTYLDPKSFIPAPCQGILAVEFRSDDSQIAAQISPLKHTRVNAAAECERMIVHALNADCTTPIGIFCEDLVAEYTMHAIVLNSSATEAVELQVKGHDPYRLAPDIATKLLAMGVEQLLSS